MAEYACERSRLYRGQECAFIPIGGKKLLIHIPNHCRTSSFLNRLKNEFGFSLLMIGLEQIDSSVKAGWKDEELVLWPCCGETPEHFQGVVTDEKTHLFRRFHAVYVDEPYDDHDWWTNLIKIGPKIISFPDRLGALHSWVKDNLQIPFIVGDFNLWYDNRWNYFSDNGVCDSVMYTGYAGDQRPEWNLINQHGANGGREWMHLFKDKDSFDELFEYANGANFSEVWLFANEKVSCSDIEMALHPFLQSATRHGWLDFHCEWKSRWETRYCVFRNCALCDPNNPEHWSPVPVFPAGSQYFDTRQKHFGMYVFYGPPLGW